MKLLFSALLLSTIALFTGTVHAAGVEHIDNLTVTAKVTAANVVQVHETVRYDFGDQAKHGIYRDIPIDYHDGATYYYTTATLKRVTQDGASAEVQKSTESGNLHLRIGDPDHTLSGVHTYTLDYEMTPFVYLHDGKPFLNLDVIGTGWQVPINQTDISVSLEDGALFSNVACFRGAQGATQTCQTPVTSGSDTITLSESNLNPGEAVTINANLPANYISNYLQPNQKRPFTFESLGAVLSIGVGVLFNLLILLVAAIGFFVFFLRRRIAARKRAHQTVVPQYEPPTSLTPAEIGHLEDDSSAMAEITATLIDLAVRGYIKITQLPPASGVMKLFKKQDYSLDTLKPITDLPANEQALLTGIMNGESSLQVSKINKSSAATAISAFKSTTKDSLEAKGFYAISGGLLSRGNLTDAGATEWAQVEGFKLYLTVAERDRLAFTDAPAKTPERFSALLPYAIALGVENEWAKQFEGIDLSQSADWYNGSTLGAFSATNLADTLSTSFQSTLSSNTSVSSGGGSSGGGGGGGGGGSW